MQDAPTEKQQSILDAGEKLFRLYGLSGTRMEAIAREAGVAKPTLYGYYPNKEAVFRAVAERLFGKLRRLVSAALADAGAPGERVAAALTAKKKAVFKILDGSPHAAELMAAQGLHAAEAMDAFDRWVEGEVARVLAEAGYQEPQKYAQLLAACADGIMKRARYPEQIGPAIRLVTEKLLA